MRQPRRPRGKTGRSDDDRVFHLFQQFVIQFLRLEVTVQVDRFSQRLSLKVMTREGIQLREQLKDIVELRQIVCVVREQRDAGRRVLEDRRSEKSFLASFLPSVESVGRISPCKRS